LLLASPAIPIDIGISEGGLLGTGFAQLKNIFLLLIAPERFTFDHASSEN
jgi:hypothetical protein